MALINGKAYSWSDIKVNILGRTVVGITAISWDKDVTKEDNYGEGNEPISRGYGNKKYEASITLEFKEVVALNEAARDQIGPDADLTDISMFPITVAYNNDSNKIVNVELQNAEFKKLGVNNEQGSTSIPVEIPLIISGIKYS